MSVEEKPQAAPGTQVEAWQDAAADPALGEDRALALLKHADLPAAAIEALASNPGIRDSRRVRLKIAMHPRTPRRISRSLLRTLYPFDLMQVARTPGVPGDVQRAAEDLLIRKLESLALGERISLARRSPGRIAAALLLAQPECVVEIALKNSRLTEPLVLGALGRPSATVKQIDELARAITASARWMQNREVLRTIENRQAAQKAEEEQGDEAEDPG